MRTGARKPPVRFIPAGRLKKAHSGAARAAAEYEVEAVLGRPMEDRPGEGGVKIAAGKTEGSRY